MFLLLLLFFFNSGFVCFMCVVVTFQCVAWVHFYPFHLLMGVGGYVLFVAMDLGIVLL